jgi:hypothetical protein
VTSQTYSSLLSPPLCWSIDSPQCLHVKYVFKMQTFPTFTLIHSNLNLQHVTVPPAGLSSAGIFSAGPSSPILLQFPTSATNCRIWQSISTSTPTGQSRVRRMSPASGNLDSVRPVQPRTPLLPVVWARLLPWLSHRKASRITAWHGSSH